MNPIDKEAASNAAAEKLTDLISEVDLDSPLPSGKTLFPHQKEAVSWLLGHIIVGRKGAILSDKMGLGKTLSALVAALILRKRYGYEVHVICPASLVLNWKREAAETGLELAGVYTWSKIPAILPPNSILIADEAHYAQSMTSNRTKAFLKLSLLVKVVFPLTGTPMKNGLPINLFPLLKAVGHSLGRNSHHYELHYCGARKETLGSTGRTFWNTRRATNLHELSTMTSDVILARTKEECVDLPAKLLEMRQVVLSPAEQKEYNQGLDAIAKKYREMVEANILDAEAESLVSLMAIRQLTSKYKIPHTLELAKEILEEGASVIIFTVFRDTAAQLAKELGGELLTGDTSKAERQAIVDRIQAKTSRVFVGTIGAGGVGITLTAANYVIMHDREWTPGDNEQAADRAHRIGQTNTVNVYWMQLGVTDTAIDTYLEQKTERIQIVMKNKKKSLSTKGGIKKLASDLLNFLSS